MKNKKMFIFAILLVLVFSFNAGLSCGDSSDDNIHAKQEQMLEQANNAVGMPSITRFNEKKLVKMLYELRDKANLQTYTYLVAEQTGKLVYVGRSIGYGIPYGTQFSNPEKYIGNQTTMPQAEPNGLFSPNTAEGT